MMSINSFGWRDYWRMFRARGPRLPIAHFFEVHLFDLRYGTDTQRRVYVEDYSVQPDGFLHAGYYGCSWTSEVVRSFRVVRAALGDTFEQYQFVDVGCGKGKVVLVWARQVARAGLRQAVSGLDFYQPLIDIARANQRVVRPDDPDLFACMSALDLGASRLSRRAILYLYNPFDDVMLRRFLASISGDDVIVIYGNPVHASVLTEAGYVVIDEHRGWHPNATTVVFRKTAG